MAEEVVIGMAVRDAGQHREFLRAKEEVAALRGEVERLSKAQKESATAGDAAGKAMSKTLLGAAAAITGVGSAIAGVSKIADLVKKQYEEMLARQSKAASAQLGIADSLHAAVSTFAGRPGAPPIDKFYNRMVAGANGVDIQDLLRSFTGMMGSAGSMEPKDVQDVVLETTKQARFLKHEDRESLGRATLMTMKEFKTPAAETMAGILRASQADSTMTLGDFSANVVPIVTSARQYGNKKETFESIAAEVMAVNLAAGDPHGRRGGTAYLNARQTIKEETLKAGLVGPGASLEEQLQAARGSKKIQELALGVFATGDGLDPTKALSAFRRNKLSKGELGGEARTFMAGVGFMQTDQNPATNAVAREYQNIMRSPPTLDKTSLDAVRKITDEFAQSKIGQLAEIDRSSKQSQAMKVFKDFDAAQESQVRQTLEDMRLNMGVDATTRAISGGIEAIRGTGNTPQERLRYVREQALASRMQLEKSNRADYEKPLLDSVNELIKRMDRQIELMESPPVQKVESTTPRTTQPAATPTAAGLSEPGQRRNGGASGQW